MRPELYPTAQNGDRDPRLVESIKQSIEAQRKMLAKCCPTPELQMQWIERNGERFRKLFTEDGDFRRLIDNQQYDEARKKVEGDGTKS